MSRCTGHCCRDFPLPVTLATLRAEPMRFRDGQQIADMVIELREYTYPDGRQGARFTCKNLRSNGDCGDYENRPWMCSAYPYGGACLNPECTADPEELVQITKCL